jgi:hypothetical protein
MARRQSEVASGGPVRTQTGTEGQGWGLFSGLALIMIGTSDFLRGLNFSSNSNPLVNAVDIKHPQTWGFVFLVVGVVVIAAGFGVFTKRPWAKKVGIAAVLLAALINAFFLLSPIESASGIALALNMFVLWALTVKWYGGGAS